MVKCVKKYCTFHKIQLRRVDRSETKRKQTVKVLFEQKYYQGLSIRV